MAKYRDDRLTAFIQVSRAIAEGNRIKILAMLRLSPMCVCQISEILRLAPSTVSKHLFILHSARLIISRKEGRWVFYELNLRSGSLLIERALEFTLEGVRRCGEIKEMTKTARDVLKLDPEVICRRLYKSKKWD